MTRPIRIFIGYDPREPIAYHVLCHSIIRRASVPVSIAPLALRHLSTTLTRERDPLQSTDFAFSRFLVPYLCDFEGWALFMDCDMLMRADVAELWQLRDGAKAAMVVKHDHRPAEESKFLGETQTTYQRKNWSSVILFNNPKCKALTKANVNRCSGLFLHQFAWCRDHEIGELPREWNYLVGVYPANPKVKPKLIHYTSGGPWFREYGHCDFADEWRQESKLMDYAATAPGHEYGPTPEMARRSRVTERGVMVHTVDPIEAMDLSEAQRRAAKALAAVCRRVCAPVSIKAPDLNRVQCGNGFLESSEASVNDLTMWREWGAACTRAKPQVHIGIVMDVLVEGWPCWKFDQQNQQRHGTTSAMVKRAIDLWLNLDNVGEKVVAPRPKLAAVSAGSPEN